MLQRIQSIFILLYAGCMAVFLFSDTIYIAVDNSIYVLSAWYLAPIGDGFCDCDICFFPFIIVGVLQVAAVLLASIAFFNYRNRKKQIQLIKIAEYLFALEVISVIYAAISTKYLSLDSFRINLKMGSLFLSISIVWLLLARFCIKKDERLVQSSDRLL